MARLRRLSDRQALTGADALTPPENDLIDACRKGVVCALGDGTRPEAPDPARNIRADLLRYLILGGCTECRVDEAGVQLVGAYVTGELELDFAKAKGQTFLCKCRFKNSVSALQARFQLLNLGGSALPGLNAQGANVTGPVYLRLGFHATGEVSLSNAKIGGQLDCHRGRFNNPKGMALNAQSAEVLGDVFFSDGFHATGEVSLSGARIGGQLDCEGGQFENSEGHALNAQKISAGALIWRKVSVPNGWVSLSAAHVGDLVDSPESWPGNGRLLLDGFTYDRIGGSASPTDAPSRLEWLAKGDTWVGVFFPQPYVQLAKVLREMGHERAARAVLIAKEKKLTAAQWHEDLKTYDALRSGTAGQQGDIGGQWLRMRASRYWAGLIGRLVGYGHAPQYALYWAAGSVAFLTVVYWVLWRVGGLVPNSAVILTSADWAGAMAISPTAPGLIWTETAPSAAHYETFLSGFYAADVFIPLINFGQEAAWTATTANAWGWIAFGMTFVFKAFGWLVTALGAALGAAAITGIIRRE